MVAFWLSFAGAFSQKDVADDGVQECAVVPEVCGIVALFNPFGFKSRRENFRRFREISRMQGLWLLAVELSYGEQGELVESVDAEVVVQIQGKEENVLWQKERLLNVGLDHLPREGCSKVVWLDSEVIFTNDNWVQETSEALQLHRVIQPFEDVVRLPKGELGLIDGDLPKLSFSKNEKLRTPGFARQLKRARHRHVTVNSQKLHGYTGFAWGMQRAILEEVRFFDVAVVGGAVS